MNFGWRVILIIIVIIVVMLVILLGFKKSNNVFEEPETPIQTSTPSVQADNLPKATGNLDDAVNSFVSDSDSETARILNDSTDVSSTTYENSEISNFGQSYENDF